MIESLRDEFFKTFADKYKLLENKPLGKGHYACVFKAFDIDRQIEVAIKIFFDGIAPKGSERGWHISSSVIHSQIAQTSTIENFRSKVLKRQCKAVVQRLIPGKTLKSLIEEFDSIEQSPNYQAVLNDFGLTYFPSLLTVLNFCHSQNFGHGDCHDGNIMVFLEQHDTLHSFRVVLIDFDNSSIKETLNAKTEKQKIESDISLIKYFYKKVFSDWKFYEAILIILNNYTSVSQYQLSYSIVSEYISKSIKGNNSTESIIKILSKLPHPFMGFPISTTIESLRKVAEITNDIENFELGLAEFKIAFAKPENWKHDFEIETIEIGVTDIYRKMFGS